MAARFLLTDQPVMGAVARHCLDGALDQKEAQFLARLWTLFGPPEDGGDGFEYTVEDTERGLRFAAYCAHSGPAYRARGITTADRQLLAPSLDAFDQLLAQTALANCRFELETDDGTFEIGAQDGRPFTRRVQR